MKRLILSLLICFFGVGCATVYNPATGRKEFIFIDTSQEVAMGKNVHQQISKEFKISSRYDQVERLRGIGARLAGVSDRQDYEYHFYLVEEKQLNAFTTPGGNIYFFSGLLDQLKTDDQIAAVLSHEIGHCAARHTVKKFQAALGYNLLSTLIFSQVGGAEETRQTAALASNTAMQLAMSAYGRKDEYEADKLGVKYMYLAGYNLNGMIETLEVLERESKGGYTPLILRTHPYVEDRIKAVREEVKLAKEKYQKKGQ